MRRRLLAVATRLFAERGIDRTSLRDVADAAHVTERLLHRHYAGKAALLDAVCARAARRDADRLERIAARPVPVVERVRAAAADAVAAAVSEPDDTTVVFRAYRPAVAERCRAVRAARHRYRVLFRALIAEGQRSGAFTTQVPADIVVDFFLGSVHHLSTWYRPADGRSVSDVGSVYADQLLDALRAARPAA
ncbi:TetR family transcriptional regulator [Marinactinospora rubrisoli]|uniref:TetR family transcriptional regulator n=1 Tax=Marinactinospora rubrisoli TaxID=2715399 RepID=A0ABW2KB99_9ACTN